MDSFLSWKRNPISDGWCCISQIDCESIEGLNLHSKTREHHKMVMYMAKSIKLQNKQQFSTGLVVIWCMKQEKLYYQWITTHATHHLHNLKQASILSCNNATTL